MGHIEPKRKPAPPRPLGRWLQALAVTSLMSFGFQALDTPAITAAQLRLDRPEVRRAKLYSQMDDGEYLFLGAYTPAVANTKLDAFAARGIGVATQMTAEGKLVLLRPKEGSIDDLVHVLEPEKPKIMQRVGTQLAIKDFQEPVYDCSSFDDCITGVDRLRHLPYFDEIKMVARELVADPKLRQYQYLNERLAQQVIITQITIESDGDPRAVSNVGAVGLTQIMPATARQYLFKDKHVPLHYIHERLMDPKFHFEALESVSKPYMAAAAARSGTTHEFIEKTLAAHNAGPGSLEGNRYKTFSETEQYVRRGLKVMELLQHKPF